MTIRFGPAYLGGVKEAEKNLRHFASLGLKACEIPFTYSVYIKKEEDAKRIGALAKELDIRLSIHAPYWVNLNSDEPEKVKKTKERILNCCKVGTWLGAYRVVFHPGYYGDDKEKAYDNIRARIQELMKECKEKGYTPKLAPEMMGKINVFGSVEEIHNLVEETGCEFCIDFAHILAREKKYRFEEVLRMFGKHNKMHIHFSGIEYGEKGEKKHKKTGKEAWEKLLAALPKNKDITIINESPHTVDDSVEGMEILGVTNS